MKQIAVILAASLAILPGPAVSATERVRELTRLVREECGACHGLTLQGGLGSPLGAEALRHKPDEALVSAILDGRAGTPMPPWRTFLTADEAQWIVDGLRRNAFGATPP